MVEETRDPRTTDCFRTEQDQLTYYCWACRIWHLYGGVSDQPGAGDGPRDPHCLLHFPDHAGAVILNEVGPFTDEVRRMFPRPRRLSRCPQCRNALPGIGTSCPVCGMAIRAGRPVKRVRR